MTTLNLLLFFQKTQIRKKSKAMPVYLESIQNPVLCVQETPKSLKSLDEWVSALSVYIAIYTEKFKGAMAGMLKYMDVIRDLARNNGDWKGYDKKFRKMKMQQKLGWGMSHQEMYFRALCGVKESYDVASISSVNSMKLSNVNVPTGYCIRYHTGKPRLIPCKNSHSFYICNKFHPATQCWYARGSFSGAQMQVNQSFTYQTQEFNNFRPSRNQFPRQRSNLPRPPRFQVRSTGNPPAVRFKISQHPYTQKF